MLLVVFVDDLDHCSPENVAWVLEAIRLYLDAPGLVFVISCDPDVVGDALVTARGDNAQGPLGRLTVTSGRWRSDV